MRGNENSIVTNQLQFKKKSVILRTVCINIYIHGRFYLISYDERQA